MDPLLVSLQDYRPLDDGEEANVVNSVVDPLQKYDRWRHRAPGPPKTAWELLPPWHCYHSVGGDDHPPLR